MARKALVTGVTGQDGSYLCELLLAKGYEVHGLIRRASRSGYERLEHLGRTQDEAGGRLTLHHGDLTDGSGLRQVLDRVEPDEVYNLAAQSHVQVSFEQPVYTANVVALGALRLLEATRALAQRTGREVRFYQAGSSEMFGSAPPPQHEGTPFAPRSPYAASKAAAHQFAVNYREAYGLFVCNGIAFNHESPRRSEAFVTRKVTAGLARIKLGLQQRLRLGDLDARRDWGFAGDYVEAMWRMLQQDEPGDYVLATGVSHSVRDLLDLAARELGLDWREVVDHDPALRRPAEPEALVGDASRARERLGWAPAVTFPELVRRMVASDLAALQGGGRTGEAPPAARPRP